MEVSIEDLREIARLAVESDLQVLYLEIGDVRMGLGKTDAAASLLFGALHGASVAVERDQPAAPQPSGEAPAAQPVTAVSAPPGAAAAAAQPVAASPDAAPPAAAPPGPEPAARDGLAEVRATSLGVVYRRPAPDQPPFVEVGGEVREGETVCLIEVMKTYNRVEAPCSGRVAEICVADGTMVEHGQTLMRIERLRG